MPRQKKKSAAASQKQRRNKKQDKKAAPSQQRKARVGRKRSKGVSSVRAGLSKARTNDALYRQLSNETNSVVDEDTGVPIRKMAPKQEKVPDPCEDDRNKYEYHTTNHYTQTTLNRGFNESRKLMVRMVMADVYDSARGNSDAEASWFLWRRDFPLRHLMDLFAESTGTPVSTLQFSFSGRVLTRHSTPASAGFEVGPLNPNLVVVTPIGTQLVRAAFKRLCALSRAGVAPVPSTTTMLGVLANEFTDRRVFAFAGVMPLLSCVAACRSWFGVVVQYALSWKLSQGKAVESDLAGFSELLQSMYMHSTPQTGDALNSLSLKKDRGAQLYKTDWWCREDAPFTFAKAAGCTQMKTCSMTGMTPSFMQKWDGVTQQRLKFFSALKARHQHPNTNTATDSPQKQTAIAAAAATATTTTATTTTTNSTTTVNSTTATTATTATTPTTVAPSPCTDLRPPEGSGNAEVVIQLAETAAQREAAVGMYRCYFSPDMHFVFPVMVGACECRGLFDFRSCVTWVALHRRTNKMLAALTWRLHRRDDGRPAVAEVLFIATWEELRGVRTGAAMVEALETLARARGCSFLYVEVGHEQPLAAKFWSSKHSFRIVRPLDADAGTTTGGNAGGNATKKKRTEKKRVCKPEQVFCDFEPGILSRKMMKEPSLEVQRTSVPIAWHHFFASKCLRFSDTQQFVKSLETVVSYVQNIPSTVRVE